MTCNVVFIYAVSMCKSVNERECACFIIIIVRWKILKIFKNIMHLTGGRANSKLSRLFSLVIDEITKDIRVRYHVACCHFCERDHRGDREKQEIKLSGDVVGEVERFKYLGSVVQNNGDFEEDMKHRVKYVWMKWREVSGVLCNKIIPVWLKGKFYKIVARPAMMYGKE